MPTSEFFHRFGLLTIKDFFDPALCAQLRSEVSAGASKRAGVVRDDVSRIDEEVRRTKNVSLSAGTKALVSERLASLRDQIASHFGIPLTENEKPQFLVYEVGDFFVPHVDSGDHKSSAYVGIGKRRVSVVIFLNGEANPPEPDSYSGGALTFYGLLADPRAKECGFPLVGEPGLLVAFRSDLRHEVTPVTAGSRYTVVSWFR